MTMALNLFEESDKNDTEDISKIEINRDFARRFEHNKKREDLQRLDDLKKKGVISDSDDSSSESSDIEDDDDLVGSNKRDLQFYDALVRVKKKDPVIQQKDSKLFSSDEEEEEEDKSMAKKEKPLYLKDVVAKHLLEEGPEFDEDPSESSKSRPKTYTEEQEEQRRRFLDAAEEAFGSADDVLFKERKKTNREEEIGDGNDDEIQKRLDEYFGEDGNLDDSEMFLKVFLRNKMWVGKEKGENKSLGEGDELFAVSEDEEELDKQDKYEAVYNFRYEEGAGDRVLGHARFMEESVRKKTNARKVQRKSKEERMAQAEFERKEELKHLKNLKKKEIKEKLEKIRSIAGIGGDGVCHLNEEYLEEEFDPEEYDQKMKAMFDVDYYDADDADPGFGSGGDDDLEKPDFDKEDELLGLPKDWDVGGTLDGFAAARERSLKLKREEEEETQAEGKGKRKRKISLREKVELDKELDEYYKLDYEDTIGDLKTRFKYRSVPSNRYGLSPMEILMADDNELNQYISMKKLAPYREDEWKLSKQKRYHLQMKKKMILQGGKTVDVKIDRKNKLNGSGANESGIESLLEASNGEASLQSRRIRRRRRQAELKLSQSRLMAYGKIPSRAKIQKKQ